MPVSVAMGSKVLATMGLLLFFVVIKEATISINTDLFY